METTPSAKYTGTILSSLDDISKEEAKALTNREPDLIYKTVTEYLQINEGDFLKFYNKAPSLVVSFFSRLLNKDFSPYEDFGYVADAIRKSNQKLAEVFFFGYALIGHIYTPLKQTTYETEGYFDHKASRRYSLSIPVVDLTGEKHPVNPFTGVGTGVFECLIRHTHPTPTTVHYFHRLTKCGAVPNRSDCFPFVMNRTEFERAKLLMRRRGFTIELKGPDLFDPLSFIVTYEGERVIANQKMGLL